ncbi:MAG: protein-export chaperone SecB [Pseudomonadota bacterium]
MADEPQAKAAPTAPPPVQIISQYVKDLSFENPNASTSLTPGQPAPQVTVNVDVRTNKIDDTKFEVVLAIKGDAKVGETQAFIVELAYAGIVNTTDVPKEMVAPLLLIEVPRLLFPFARAVIADATREGGYPPMMVQPIDFADLFRRQMERLRSQQGEAAGNGSGDQTS